MTQENRQEVALATETIALIRAEICGAVAEGITAAMTDKNAERFFSAFFEVMSKQAAAKTGSFVLGGLGGLAKRALWLVIALCLLYNLGGWVGVKAAWSAIQAHNGG